MCILQSASPCGLRSAAVLGPPVLVVIPVRDSTLAPDCGETNAQPTMSARVRQRIMADASKGLGLGELDGMGFSFRIMVVGLHEFESKSRAAAAAGEGIVFAGKLEEACSREFARKLADLSGGSFRSLVCLLAYTQCVAYRFAVS